MFFSYKPDWDLIAAMGCEICGLSCAEKCLASWFALDVNATIKLFWATLDVIATINNFDIGAYMPQECSQSFFNTPYIVFSNKFDGNVIASMGHEIHSLSCAGKPLGF
jgi:hypothetical protein